MGRRLSVIIPCYNYAHYLPECVGSLREQTYKEFDILVVDDGSPDNTQQVCHMLGVRCVTKPNGGLSSARNYGINQVDTDYIMCLDADDKLPPRSLEYHMGLAAEDVIAQCAYREFGDSTDIHFPRGATLQSMWHANSVYCNAVFPKKKWAEVGGYDESETMRLGYEDWEFWIRLMKAGCKVRTSHEVGLLYRMHSKSMTKATTRPNFPLLHKYVQDKHNDLRNP